LKFVEFKIGYHKGELEGVFSKYANKPLELPAEYGAVTDAIFNAIGH
jgi:threonine synthase